MRDRLSFYFTKIFRSDITADSPIACKLNTQPQLSLNINVNDTSITFKKLEEQDESYVLSVSLNKVVSITAPTYFGFIHSLETLA